MRFYASGLVANEYNDVLLIKRDDSRTWAPPGGGIELDELPPAAAAREVEEETGVKVLPVRLVALQYRPDSPQDALVFVFRCLIRGGQPTPSAESPRVGFFRSADPPRPMLDIHRRMLQSDLNHSGGPAHWYRAGLPASVRLARALIYGYRNTRRRLLRQPPYDPPPAWRTFAYTMIRNQAGQVLWVKQRQQEFWTLPGGPREGREAPWNTAVRTTALQTGIRVRLTALNAVYTYPVECEAGFFFTAEIAEEAIGAPGEGAEYAYYAPGEEPPQAAAGHARHTANLRQKSDVTVFYRQADGATGL